MFYRVECNDNSDSFYFDFDELETAFNFASKTFFYDDYKTIYIYRSTDNIKFWHLLYSFNKFSDSFFKKDINS